MTTVGRIFQRRDLGVRATGALGVSLGEYVGAIGRDDDAADPWIGL
jgi:hypothetical protein